MDKNSWYVSLHILTHSFCPLNAAIHALDANRMVNPNRLMSIKVTPKIH